MFRRSAAIALATITIAGGCTRSATGQRPTPAMISDVLLTVTDMPPGWEETQRQVFDQRGPENPSIDPSVWCAESAMVTKNLVSLAGPAGADVEMQMTSSPGRPRMMRLQGWANSDVRAYYADAKEAAHICDGTDVIDESGVRTTFELLAGRDLGDESISWVQKATPPESTQGDKFETLSRTTVARFGGIVMVLQLGDAAQAGTTALLDEDAWWAIVTSAGEKLASLDKRVHP